MNAGHDGAKHERLTHDEKMAILSAGFTEVDVPSEDPEVAPPPVEAVPDHAAGNRAAVEKLLDSSRAGLHAYTKSILNTIRKFETNLDALADDVLHDSVELVWKYIASHPDRPIVNPEAFMHTVIYNGCISELRKLESQKTEPSGEVDMAERALESHPFFKEAPESPEDALLAKESVNPDVLWDFVFHGKALPDGETLASPKGMKNFERNLEIFKMKIEGVSSEDVVAALQEKGLLKEYDLGDPAQRKKAVNLIDAVTSRVLSHVRKELGV